MDFELSGEQKILREAAHRMLVKECTSSFVRAMENDPQGYSTALWEKMAGLGWMGLMIPENYGGVDGSFADIAVLLGEMGYVCLPSPFFSNTVVSAPIILAAGSEKQKKGTLPAMAAGRQILTLAWIEESANYSPDAIWLTAERNGDNYVLSGSKLFVPDAHVADKIICAIRTRDDGKNSEEGISLLLVPKDTIGLQIEQLPTIAGDKQFELRFDHAEIPMENLLGEPDHGWPILENILYKASVGKCAEMIGGARKVIEMVLFGAKERVQFGKPIGSFQAIQHHCANMLTFLDTSELLTYQAAWMISEGLPYERASSMCKAWVSDSYRRLLMLGHSVLGGMGFMEEHDIQLFYRRAKASELAFGDSDFHRERVAGQMEL